MPKNATPSMRDIDRIAATRDVPAGCSLRDIQARNGYKPTELEPVIVIKTKPRPRPAPAPVAKPETHVMAPEVTPALNGLPPYGEASSPTPAARPKACAHDDCWNPPKAKGLCQRHYDQQRHTPTYQGSKVIYSRARYCATTILIERHRTEFDQLVTDSLAALKGSPFDYAEGSR